MIKELSEAIRIGSMLSPQGFNGLYNDESRCALAAACDAVGLEPLRCGAAIVTVPYTALEDRFPVLGICVPHPIYNDGTLRPVYQIVYSLNDTCNWTRARIADWVESIERSVAHTGTMA